MAGIVQESEHDHSHNHHVKFNLQEEEVRSHHEHLEISSPHEHTFNINLGYLKVNHYYRVAFSLDLSKNTLCGDLNALISRFSVEKSSKNISFKEIKVSSDGVCTFLIVFFASKEKLDRESIYFINHNLQNQSEQQQAEHHHHQHHQNGNEMLTINFEAKVLGAHQGTPLLRTGITLLAQHQPGEKSHFNIN